MSNGTSTIAAPASPSHDGDHDDRYAVRVRNLQHYFGEGDLKKQVLFDNNPTCLRRNRHYDRPFRLGQTTLLTPSAPCARAGRQSHGAGAELLAPRPAD